MEVTWPDISCLRTFQKDDTSVIWESIVIYDWLHVKNIFHQKSVACIVYKGVENERWLQKSLCVQLSRVIPTTIP